MTCYLIQAHYPDTRLILIMYLASLNVNVIGLTRPGLEPMGSNTTICPKQESDTQLIQPSHLVSRLVIKSNGGKCACIFQLSMIYRNVYHTHMGHDGFVELGGELLANRRPGF